MDNEWLTTDTDKGRLLRAIIQPILQLYGKSSRPFYCSCDATAMAVVLDRSVATETQDVYVTVELAGNYTKGQMICDWRKKFDKEANATIVTKYDASKVRKHLGEMLK